jgi:hypothetical protein
MKSKTLRVFLSTLILLCSVDIAGAQGPIRNFFAQIRANRVTAINARYERSLERQAAYSQVVMARSYGSGGQAPSYGSNGRSGSYKTVVIEGYGYGSSGGANTSYQTEECYIDPSTGRKVCPSRTSSTSSACECGEDCQCGPNCQCEKILVGVTAPMIEPKTLVGIKAPLISAPSLVAAL